MARKGSSLGERRRETVAQMFRQKNPGFLEWVLAQIQKKDKIQLIEKKSKNIP